MTYWVPPLILGLFMAGCAVQSQSEAVSAERQAEPKTTPHRAPSRSTDQAPAPAPRRKVDPDTMGYGLARLPARLQEQEHRSTGTHHLVVVQESGQ